MNGVETIQENNVAKIVIGTNIIVKCLVITEPDINYIQLYKADNMIGGRIQTEVHIDEGATDGRRKIRIGLKYFFQ